MNDQDRGGRRRTLVVGGGLAGISCALRLSDLGHRVELIERSGHLGGLCRSVPDPVMGRIDTGQHVYLGCCSSLEALLGRLKVRPALRQRRLELTVVNPATAASRRLRAAPLPAPLHLLPVLARWPGLSRSALLEAGRVATALRSWSVEELDSVPALGWLQSLGQSPATIGRLWDPFLVAACNVSLQNCSAAAAAQVLSKGLLGTADGAALRVPGTDLTSWLSGPAERALQAAGVAVRVRFRADAINLDDEGQVVASDPDGNSVVADQVVLATAARHAHRLLKLAGVSDPEVAKAADLPDSPIVNVHLFTDRPFLPAPVVVVPDSPLQWLFDRSALSPEEGGGRGLFHSAISLSAAEEWVAVGEDALVDRMWKLCRSTFPAAARARLETARVTREAHATFAPIPGSATVRPGPASSVRSVYLAGSWTATGWPATMEGAVRSGEAAADAMA